MSKIEVRRINYDNPLKRVSSPYLDAILGHAYPVLDRGFIRVIDYMGDDSSIIQMAKMSYDAGNQPTPDERTLLRYLFRHWHTSPFEGCEIKLHLKMPIFIARQWIRHRMASLNEISGRYSILKDEFFVPLPADIKQQSKSNKQGRGDTFDYMAQMEMRDIIEQASTDAFAKYDVMNKVDVAKETSRIILPLNTYTEFYWKIDLHNLLHFLRLRMHPHAQKEIRDYADEIYHILGEWVPLTAEAFRDYRLEAITFSRMEKDMLSKLFSGESLEQVLYENPYDMSRRELGEFKAKMSELL